MFVNIVFLIIQIDEWYHRLSLRFIDLIGFDVEARSRDEYFKLIADDVCECCDQESQIYIGLHPVCAPCALKYVFCDEVNFIVNRIKHDHQLIESGFEMSIKQIHPIFSSLLKKKTFFYPRYEIVSVMDQHCSEMNSIFSQRRKKLAKIIAAKVSPKAANDYLPTFWPPDSPRFNMSAYSLMSHTITTLKAAYKNYSSPCFLFSLSAGQAKKKASTLCENKTLCSVQLFIDAEDEIISTIAVYEKLANALITKSFINGANDILNNQNNAVLYETNFLGRLACAVFDNNLSDDEYSSIPRRMSELLPRLMNERNVWSWGERIAFLNKSFGPLARSLHKIQQVDPNAAVKARIEDEMARERFQNLMFAKKVESQLMNAAITEKETQKETRRLQIIDEKRERTRKAEERKLKQQQKDLEKENAIIERQKKKDEKKKKKDDLDSKKKENKRIIKKENLPINQHTILDKSEFRNQSKQITESYLSPESHFESTELTKSKASLVINQIESKNELSNNVHKYASVAQQFKSVIYSKIAGRLIIDSLLYEKEKDDILKAEIAIDAENAALVVQESSSYTVEKGRKRKLRENILKKKPKIDWSKKIKEIDPNNDIKAITKQILSKLKSNT